MLELIHSSAFYELTALLVLAGAVGFIGLLLKQPMVVSFIAVGVIAGPSVLGVVSTHDHVELLAKLGIVILLFLVGLKLDLKLIKTLGLVSLLTGLGQVLFTSITGFFIGLALGLNTVTSIYVAVALTFSSTIIIVKLLSDKKEVDALHGKIAIGFLIVQDLVVVLAMMTLATFGVGSASSEGNWLWQIGSILLHGMIILAVVGLFIRYVANPLIRKIAHSSELLVTFAIAWAALLAGVSAHFGLSMELGGLLAGISLASTPFREAIIARLASLRDFLLLFFFIVLGSQLDLSLLSSQIIPALIFSVFVLIGNPIIVMVIMGLMGYRKRTSFCAGLTVAQISEFSLIFMAMGFSVGHVSAQALGLVTLVGLITIALSVYMITYSEKLYQFLEPYLGVFERQIKQQPNKDSMEVNKPDYQVLVFGLGRYGSTLVKALLKQNLHVLAVDLNPYARSVASCECDVIYGDAADPEFVASLPLKKASLVVSTLKPGGIGLTHEDARFILLNTLREQMYTGQVAIVAHSALEQPALKARGATVLWSPVDDAVKALLKQIKDC